MTRSFALRVICAPVGRATQCAAKLCVPLDEQHF